MIQQQVIEIARQKVGQYLKQIREEKNLSYYAVAGLSGLQIHQIQSLENGDSAYTLDSFLKLIHALDCYFFLENKDGKHLDFVDMAEKATRKMVREGKIK